MKEFQCTLAKASPDLLRTLRRDYRETGDWAYSILTQGFNMDDTTATQLLKGETECQIQDQKFVL